jgi:hypothetical protein
LEDAGALEVTGAFAGPLLAVVLVVFGGADGAGEVAASEAADPAAAGLGALEAFDPAGAAASEGAAPLPSSAFTRCATASSTEDAWLLAGSPIFSRWASTSFEVTPSSFATS